jgi:hypothetical protein
MMMLDLPNDQGAAASCRRQLHQGRQDGDPPLDERHSAPFDDK